MRIGAPGDQECEFECETTDERQKTTGKVGGKRTVRMAGMSSI